MARHNLAWCRSKRTGSPPHRQSYFMGGNPMKTVLARESKSPSLSLLPEIEAEALSIRAAAIHESVARRAYELFEERGQQDGHDVEDWLRAEFDILEPLFIETDDADDAL